MYNCKIRHFGYWKIMHLPVEIEVNDKKSLAKKIPSSWTWVWKKHLIVFENFLKCLIWNSTPKNISILLFGAKMAKIMILGKVKTKLIEKCCQKRRFYQFPKTMHSLIFFRSHQTKFFTSFKDTQMTAASVRNAVNLGYTYQK